MTVSSSCSESIESLAVATISGWWSYGYGKKGRGREEYYEEEGNEEDGGVGVEDGSSGSKRMRRADVGDGPGSGGYGYGLRGKAEASGQFDRKVDGRSHADREADDEQLLQLEEKDVVSSVAIVLSDLCGPEEWMPMLKLHRELVEQFSNVWHHTRVRRYLTSEDFSSPESNAKPWHGLLKLLSNQSTLSFNIKIDWQGCPLSSSLSSR